MSKQIDTHESTQTDRDNRREVADLAGRKAAEAGEFLVAQPARDLWSEFQDYARQKPDVAAMWCFGLGLMVGWKLRG